MAASFLKASEMDIQADGKKFSNLSKINVLLGKNGSGKSTLLRAFDQRKNSLPNVGEARYVTPERGGQLSYEGGIETQLVGDPSWAANRRRQNRYDNFRQMSVTGANTGFDILAKGTSEKRGPETLSSGESELVSLAIEILSFAYGAETHSGKTSYLFLDEPDVHLHPDLQERLMTLLQDAVDKRDIVVVIATHSTAILGALSNYKEARVGFVSAAQAEVDFVPIDETMRRILPIFGAHPLSNIFNKTPILLVEGEDDERVWQQAVRTSQGKLRIWPCQAGDIQSLNEYEDQVEAIAGAVYENAMAYSLRDRDDSPYEIEDKAIVKRTRLWCRAAENLLLSDDVLALLGIDWDKMKAAIEDWLSKYSDHSQFPEMKAFKTGGYDRIRADLKPLCNIIMMLAGSKKPWEVAVGQAIARLLTEPEKPGEHSLTAYLGPELVDALNLRTRVLWSLKYLQQRSNK